MGWVGLPEPLYRGGEAGSPQGWGAVCSVLGLRLRADSVLDPCGLLGDHRCVQATADRVERDYTNISWDLFLWGPSTGFENSTWCRRDR